VIGTISGKPWIDRAKNGRTKVVFLQVKFALDGDVRTVQYFPGSGVDDVPCDGDIVEVIRDGGILQVVSIKDKAEPRRESGEKELYARNANGNRLADILLDKDGGAEISSASPEGDRTASLNLKPGGEANLSSATAAGKQADITLGVSGAAIAAMAAGQLAAAHTLKPSGTQYLGNTLAGQDVFTVMDTWLTALVKALNIATGTDPQVQPPPTQDPGALAAFISILAATAALQTQWALIFDPVPPVPEPPEGGEA
jgi:hypothetical protein